MGVALGAGACLKGRYRLERLLGRGGMASVWRACDLVLDRPVAVKVLSDTIASDPEFVARFRREARVAAGLSHPNLVGVYDYAEEDERPYLAMEYVPGKDLGALLASGAPFDCEKLARELLGALAHIHAAGIVHRDVKPQNLLLTADGSLKLIDFGIALPADATSLTRTGSLLGTARYMAPETMRGRPATPRSDLYSCGVVLADCVMRGGPSHLGALASRLSASEPASRPASAREALELLERAPAASEATQRFGPAELAAPRERARRALASRRPFPAWAAAFLAALAALGGVLALLSDGSQRRATGETAASASADRPAASSGDAAEPAPVPTPTGDDPTLGGALNEEGFALIQAGRYEEAIPVLEEAVRAFPPGTADLNYAYALFNLGNALRLGGRPEDAIPVLERRLEIPNQTPVVRRELAAAQREASS